MLAGPISPKSVASSGTGWCCPEHDVPAHHHGLRRAPDPAPKDDPGCRPAHPAGPQGRARHRPRRPGRGRVLARRPLRLRLELLDDGPGFGPDGQDVCSPASGYDRSTSTGRPPPAADRQAYRVGWCRRYVAVTTDGRYVLVSNWCSYDLSVISVRRAGGASHPDRRLPARDRGGARRQRRLRRGDGLEPPRPARPAPLDDQHRRGRRRPARRRGRPLRPLPVRLPERRRPGGQGRPPQRPGGRQLGHRQPAALAHHRTRRPGAVRRQLRLGTISKLRASDLRVLQTIPACYHPIGITYDAPTRRVWVACYTGSIRVYDDR